MKKRSWKVGDLARVAGVTVRALHHYEEIGLLVPSGRNPGRQRLYSEQDVSRLQQILALKQLGMSLQDIKEGLAKERLSTLRIVRMQRAAVEDERRRVENLYFQLCQLEKTLSSRGALSIEEILKTMEVTKMYQKYLTKEQMELIAERRAKLRDSEVKRVNDAWPKLIAQLQAEMARGTSPDDPRLRKLALKWKAQVDLISGGDQELRARLGEMVRNEPSVLTNVGISQEIFQYVGKMMKPLRR
jgi:MerR family transcriptional regulator, thiopeptide resistance regulator